jgi:hypothetical protein
MRRYFALTLWVLILVAIPAALYGWYFLAQQQLIAEMDKRELGRAADNLRSILQNSVDTVSNLTTKSTPSACEFHQPYLEMPLGKTCHEVSISTGQYAKPAYLKVAEDGLIIEASSNLKSSKTKQMEALQFRVDLDKILGELVVGNGFDYLFVADEKGQVLFQTRYGERKRWIDKLRWTDRQARDESIKTSEPIRLDNIAGLTGSPRADSAAKMASTTSGYQVEIAGEKYQLYLQPLTSLVEIETKSGSPESKAIIVGGLVNSRASFAEALSVDPRIAWGLAILAGLGLLAWPIVKLHVLAPTERFTFADFYLLQLSVSAILGISVVVLLDIENYSRLQADREKYLEDRGTQLADEAAAELVKSMTQLSAYDSALASSSRLDCSAKAEATKIFSPSTTNTFQIAPPDAYKLLNQVFWVRGDDGMQFAKASTIESNTPFVDVSARTYFQQARQNHLWAFGPVVKNAPKDGFFVQVYRSITTGEFETGVSMPSQVKCKSASLSGSSDSAAKGGNFPNVAVLTITALASLSPKSLPADYGFMLIDRSGLVLYHSDQRLALREELFEEVGDPERLRSILLSNRPAWFKSDYRGVPHELLIRPFSELVTKMDNMSTTGWYIVTFRDLQLARTANSEAGLMALVWCTFYFLIFLCIPALIFVVRGPKHSRWIWPDPNGERLYRNLTIGLTVLAIASSVVIWLAHGWGLLLVSALTGVSGLSFSVERCVRWRRTEQLIGDTNAGSPGNSLSLLQVVSAALLLVLVAMLPAVGFFKYSWNQELGSLAAYDAKHMYQTREDLALQITDRAKDKFAKAYGESWRQIQIARDAIKEETDDIGDASEVPKDWDSLDILTPLKPVYNDATEALRYQAANPELLVSGKLGNFSMKFWILASAGVTALIGILLLQIRSWGQRLFLSDLSNVAAKAKTAIARIELAHAGGQNIIVIASVHAQEEEVRKLMVRPVGSADMTIDAAQESQRVSKPQVRGTIISLAEDLFKSESRQIALRRLERAASDGGAVVFSRFDPALILFGEYTLFNSEEGDKNPRHVQLDDWERRSWSDVLNRFDTIAVPVMENSSHAAKQHGQGRSFYRSLWNSCTNIERLVLVQVAEEGFANPHQKRIVKRLLKRGLLKMAPALELFEPGFEEFVRQVAEREAVSNWERPEKGMGWKQTRWILTAVIVVVGTFLLATQRQALDPIVAFLPALTAAVGGILKLVSDLSPKPTVQNNQGSST